MTKITLVLAVSLAQSRLEMAGIHAQDAGQAAARQNAAYIPVKPEYPPPGKSPLWILNHSGIDGQCPPLRALNPSL